jgi:D-psicose/D-tagatose/L-ribulose 3-epimerase
MEALMNPVGIYYAYWERKWEADYLPYIDKVKRLGFDVLELAAGALPDLSKNRRLEIASAARYAGIELTYCIGLPRQYDLADPDASIRSRGKEYVTELLRFIEEMGGKLIGGIICSSWPNVPQEGISDKRPWWDRVVNSVREVSAVARDAGILYCLEVVNRFEQFLINTAEEG